MDNDDNTNRLAPRAGDPAAPPVKPQRRDARAGAADLPPGWTRRGWYRYPVNVPGLPKLAKFRRQRIALEQRTREL